LYFALYYGVFRYAIVKLDLKTPGRDTAESSAPAASPPTSAGERAVAYVAALGGPANLVSVDACTTRLRLVVGKQEAVNTDALKALGARGFVRPSPTALQVVIGANADQIAGEIRAALRSNATVSMTAAGAATVAESAPVDTRQLPAAAGPDTATVQNLLAALGGRGNVRTVDVAASRLRIGVVKTATIDPTAIRSLGLRGVTVLSPECVHVIVGPAADVTSRELRRLLA
jgi:PTS system N-acetylglucosamine-specific IIC component